MDGTQNHPIQFLAGTHCMSPHLTSNLFFFCNFFYCLRVQVLNKKPKNRDGMAWSTAYHNGIKSFLRYFFTKTLCTPCAYDFLGRLFLFNHGDGGRRSGPAVQGVPTRETGRLGVPELGLAINCSLLGMERTSMRQMGKSRMVTRTGKADRRRRSGPPCRSRSKKRVRKG